MQMLHINHVGLLTRTKSTARSIQRKPRAVRYSLVMIVYGSCFIGSTYSTTSKEPSSSRLKV